jgi:hypothetical protein
MARKKPFGSLHPEGCLEALAAGLNDLEARERLGQAGVELWREVRSIIGGIVPAVHWASVKPPMTPKRSEPGYGALTTGVITTPDARWAAAGLNRLMRSAGITPATRLDASGAPETFVHQPTERARVAWALWWCLRIDEIKRLRRCDGCGKWFRDKTRPLNQRRCSAKCTKKINMRAYRASLRRKAAARQRRTKGGK